MKIISKEINKIDVMMQDRLEMFRAKFRKYYEAVKEIESEYDLKAGENIIKKGG